MANGEPLPLSAFSTITQASPLVARLGVPPRPLRPLETYEGAREQTKRLLKACRTRLPRTAKVGALSWRGFTHFHMDRMPVSTCPRTARILRGSSAPAPLGSVHALADSRQAQCALSDVRGRAATNDPTWVAVQGYCSPYQNTPRPPLYLSALCAHSCRTGTTTSSISRPQTSPRHPRRKRAE